MKTFSKPAFYALTVLWILSLAGCGPDTPREPYLDPKLPVDVRVKDLVSRMTVEEKVSQMMDRADSIPRLGIPMYNWWNEGLHGVGRSGIATVFPQAIGAAAMFDDSLLFVEARAISNEFRAKYNEYIRNNERNRYGGLTVWSPNINIFRDPRWGRGQETFGEDPYLTSRLGVAFVKGLQGDHPKYLQTVATPKHFAVHSGPEPLRHEFDVDVSERDFLETYLPMFEATIKEGEAASIMSVYNRFRGESGTGSKLLLTKILREKWGFNGYVVSDCGAVRDIFENHKIVSSEAEAVAVALKAGCDLNCGTYYRYLPDALEQGLITEADLDTALIRLFTARFRLGMFDPEEMVPFNQIPYSVNDSPEHRELSKITARKSIVLLKNENNVLPLKKDLKTIAVIGPSADEAEIMYGNYNGFPSKWVTPLQGIKNAVSETTEVLYAQGCYIHQAYPIDEVIAAQYLETDGKRGLKGEYFSNRDLSGEPTGVRVDSIMRTFFRGNPMPGVEEQNFSVRWTGLLNPPASGNYTLSLRASKGYRLFVNGVQVIDNWDGSKGFTSSAEVTLNKEQFVPIRIDYLPDSTRAFFNLRWKTPSLADEKEALDMASKADVVIFVGGLSPRLEGEEMQVSFEGFEGGDRTDISLPDSQEKLLKKLNALGKPVVLVLLNGSALAVNWADANLPAIVEAWYPGQEGGTAIADVLFGDYNPAGRLPVTFYKSIDQLPPFVDYDMEGRTYKYFKKEPLYPFGHGLSYTTFSYSNLKAPAKVTSGETFTVTVDVENTGEYDGDEVVQLYVRHQDAGVPVPIHALQGFKRVAIGKGQKKTVTFTLTPRHLSLIDEQDRRVERPGQVLLFVDGGQPDETSLSSEMRIEGEVMLIE